MESSQLTIHHIFQRGRYTTNQIYNLKKKSSAESQYNMPQNN
jgi:hypothetical protein